MTALTLTVQQSGERLDAFLARSVEGLTRSAAQRLLEDGAVTSCGKALKKNDRPTLSRWTSSPRTSLWTWYMRTGM